MRLEKDQQSLQKDVVALKEELDIASLDPREANNKFTARVNDFKEGAKRMEERAAHVSYLWTILFRSYPSYVLCLLFVF